MLIITLGTVASASTWTFNIARCLLASNRRKVVSIFAQQAEQVLSNIPDYAEDIVVKAHSIDYSMLRLMNLADTRVILTLRDPKDSVASQIERTGMTFHDAVSQLSGTFATLAMIGDYSNVLILHYEDHFTSNRDTIGLIAHHLKVTVGELTVDTLLRIFGSENVREETAKGQRDTVTHWINNHVGDGAVGKWRKRLSEAQGRAVSEAFPSYFTDDSWKRFPIYWSSVLFYFVDGRDPTGADTLSFPGAEGILVYGPYLCLPAGRWRIALDLRPTSMTDPVTFKLDVFINSPNRGVLQLWTVTLPPKYAEQMVFDFDNMSHSEPLEIRIYSVNDGRPVSATFLGMKLNWLGPVERNSLLAARPVAETDLVLRTAPGLFDASAASVVVDS